MNQVISEIAALRQIAANANAQWLASSRGAAEANKAAARLSRINKWLRQRHRSWVPLDKKRPDVNRHVLVHVVEEGIVSIVVARDTGTQFLDDHNCQLGGIPTHWQSLPEHP
jgi:hypothetical protein